MKQTCGFVLAALLLATPLRVEAQETGPSLMERGAQLFLEGILKEMEPALDELGNLSDEIAPKLRSFVEEMGPKLTSLLEEIEDWSAYEAPEILPNGDIIIRRKPETPDPAPVVPEADMPQIDL